ncbi:hypothetical protein SFC76_03055 [Sphingomonas sp. CD22]|uniref:hypothetical protein n=1 Tax=Sphingomonas sp. CD22 TaxID=3100214 RepID=UPI002ADF73DD|nr:hypothetical protein [Sphingomonas sp. CD22]MEA1083227.1 hypothetical protein [Sphingomonas sp. CD22]
MKRSTKIKRKAKTPAELAAELVQAKGEAIGVPAAQLARGGYVEVDVPLRDGGRVVSLKTLSNRGATPVGRWKAAGLLSASQIAAIDHCEALWSQLGGKGLVMDFDRVGGAGQGNGWAEQEALDDLARFKGYIPAKYWTVFENVCRFDEPAGTAGSSLSTNARSAIDTARVVVMFVADIIAMRERLA